MKREFRMNAVWIIGAVFLTFLTGGITENSLADGYSEMGADRDPAESARSSATEDGYCGQDAQNGNEEIASVSHVFSGTGTELEVKVSLKGPFFVFGSCLVGIVDGKDQQDMLNSLLSLYVRGALAASGITRSPSISDFCDIFTSQMLKGRTAGEALCSADKNYNDKGFALYEYTRLEMNLFGLPWAEITPPIKSDDDIGRRTGKSARGKIRKSSVRSTARGTNIKRLEVDASDYDILEVEKFLTLEGIEGFETVNVEGFDLCRMDPSIPVVPYARFDFNIPSDTEIDDIQVIFSNPVDLGQLNIPAFLPYAGMGPGGYVACPDDIGVYPAEQYSYRRIDHGSAYNTVSFTIFPMVFDTATKQATLYRNIDIEVTYTSSDRGVVLYSLFSGGDGFEPDEYIEMTLVIENTSAYSNKFDATLQLKTLEGDVVLTNTESWVIESNSTKMVSTGLRAPADQESDYHLVVTVSDGTRIIWKGGEYINVIPARVLSFAPPASFNNSMFVIEVQNVSDSRTDLLGKIYIHNRDNEEVAELPLITETIDSGISRTVAVPWTPPDSLPSGRYTAMLDAALGSNYLTLFSDPFFVTRLKDVITALKTLAGTDGDDHACLDMNGDGKTGSEDVIFILQTLAERRN